jgi:hypothetical protein
MSRITGAKMTGNMTTPPVRKCCARVTYSISTNSVSTKIFPSDNVKFAVILTKCQKREGAYFETGFYRVAQ